MMKKFLITGHTGFVGRYFIDFLEENKIKSIVLGIDTVYKKEKIVYEYVEVIDVQVDLLDICSIEKTLDSFQPDYILHLASYSSVAFSWKNPVLSFQNNMNIFLNLVESVRKLEMSSRILSVGSSEEYGNVNAAHLPLTESSLLDPISPYAVARVSQGFLSKVYTEGYKLNIIITRSFNHIGPGQKDIFVISSFAKQIAKFKQQGLSQGTIITGDLSIVRDFVDVRDVVRAYYLLLTKGEIGEIYNICSGQGIALHQIIEKLSIISGIEVSTQINPDYVRLNDNKKIIGSYDKIYKYLQWKPEISIEKSLSDIYNSWLNHPE